VIGYSLADENEWRKQDLELASICVERCEKIRQTLQSESAVPARFPCRRSMIQSPGSVVPPRFSRSSRVHRESYCSATPSSMYIPANFDYGFDEGKQDSSFLSAHSFVMDAYDKGLGDI
jgi:hypothetical protein